MISILQEVRKLSENLAIFLTCNIKLLKIIQIMTIMRTAFRKAALKRIKTSTAGFPNYGVPRQVHCTLDAWTIDNGLLTPTLKMKRNLIRQRYTAEINALYDTLVKR